MPSKSDSSIDRRSFLTTSARVTAGLTAAAAAPSVLGASAPSETIRLAIVGVGGRGTNHAEGFAQLDGVEVVSVSDPDSGRQENAARKVEEHQGKKPATISDFRKVLDDNTVDGIVVSTPDHWHGPATIWACQAGKDVYVEKPCAHNFREAKLMVEAARKYKRVVQHGTQSRSAEHTRDAMELLHSGELGRILQAKAVNCQQRSNIGHKADAPVPEGVDYDMWLGPAPKRPFNPNRFHYNWHWCWDYGTGDMGNDGVHQIDLARWGLGDPGHPLAITCGGGKYWFDDDQETPDTQNVTFEWEDKSLVYEMRLWTPYGEHGMDNGNVFYGEKGFMVLHRTRSWAVYWKNGEKGPHSQPKNNRGRDHRENFLDCMRTRERPIADIETGYYSSALTHFGNLAYRVKRRLEFDRNSLSVVGDAEANRLLGREYRKPFEIADAV